MHCVHFSCIWPHNFPLSIFDQNRFDALDQRFFKRRTMRPPFHESKLRIKSFNLCFRRSRCNLFRKTGFLNFQIFLETLQSTFASFCRSQSAKEDLLCSKCYLRDVRGGKLSRWEMWACNISDSIRVLVVESKAKTHLWISFPKTEIASHQS